MDLESRGVPSGFVASEEFVDAAAAQGKSLGISPLNVFVAHPIQDRTNEEMAKLAKDSIESITALICGKK